MVSVFDWLWSQSWTKTVTDSYPSLNTSTMCSLGNYTAAHGSASHYFTPTERVASHLRRIGNRRTMSHWRSPAHNRLNACERLRSISKRRAHQDMDRALDLYWLAMEIGISVEIQRRQGSWSLWRGILLAISNVWLGSEINFNNLYHGLAWRAQKNLSIYLMSPNGGQWSAFVDLVNSMFRFEPHLGLCFKFWTLLIAV